MSVYKKVTFVKDLNSAILNNIVYPIKDGYLFFNEDIFKSEYKNIIKSETLAKSYTKYSVTKVDFDRLFLEGKFKLEDYEFVDPYQPTDNIIPMVL